MLAGTYLLTAALMFAGPPRTGGGCTPLAVPPASAPLGGPPSCSFGNGHFAGTGKAPRGYEEFACFPAGFYFRRGTAELVERTGEVSMAVVYKYSHEDDEWVVLTLSGRSEDGKPFPRALLHRRARNLLDWLSRQGRRRDRVEVRVAPEEKSVSLDVGSPGADAKAEFGAYVTGLIPPDAAERIRQSIRANPRIIYC